MTSPTDSTVERPLLLSPYFDRPEDHFQFPPAVNGMMVGTIAAKTSRGEASIRICRLDRKELDSARRLAQENTLNAIKIAIVSNDSASSEFQRLESGTSPFSAACLSAAETWISRLR
jgi:hypothetical protein